MEKHRIHCAALKAKLDSAFLSKMPANSAASCTCAYCTAALLDENLISTLIVLCGDISRTVKEVPIYVIGYVQLKSGLAGEAELDTYFEYNEHSAFFNIVNRGDLTVPTDSFVYLEYYSYIAFSVLTESEVPCFSKTVGYCKAICSSYKLLPDSRRALACKIIANIMMNNFTSLTTPLVCKEPHIKLAKLDNCS
jgi:hypothetical protein